MWDSSQEGSSFLGGYTMSTGNSYQAFEGLSCLHLQGPAVRTLLGALDFEDVHTKLR